jgi:SAM-dependent methyltransferase
MAYGQMAYVYDQLMQDMPYDEWVAWVMRSVPDKSATIVDLGCGTGNVAIPLAKLGYDVIGIDYSDSMLAIASDKADRTPVQWLEQNMTDWQVEQPVDAVVCFCDGFNYLLDEDDFYQTLIRTEKQLKPGGILLFDLLTANQMQRYAAEQPYQYETDNLTYMWTCDWEEDVQTIFHELTFFVKAEDDRYDRFEEQHEERAYAIDDVVYNLEKFGFVDIQVSSHFGQGPVGDDTPRVFISARKR